MLSAPDSIAWLLNVRGADVANSPLPHSFAVVHSGGDVDWFVDRRKLLPEVPAHLGNAVHVQAPETMADVIDGLADAGKAVLIDEVATPVWMVDRLTEGGAELIRGADPCALPKACKNAVELDGIRAAHRRDGAALTRFLAWLAAAPPGSITELDAVDRLAAQCAQTASTIEARASTPSLAPAPTALSSTTERRKRAIARWSPAPSTSSIRAGSTWTAPPT